MQTYKDFILENKDDAGSIHKILLESQLTEDQLSSIDSIVKEIVEQCNNGKDLDLLLENAVEEGFLGSILGGLTGFALGKTIGSALARVLGVEKGILYDLLTSRLVAAAIGSSLGKKL